MSAESFATQDEMWEYIKDYYVAHGLMPSVRSMAKAFGYNTTSGPRRTMDKLVESGRLRRVRRGRATIYVIPRERLVIKYIEDDQFK